MDFWYGARAIFDRLSQDKSLSWDNYIKWSRLNHLTELVSLDSILNEDLVEPNLENEDYWNSIVVDEQYSTGFHTKIDYVLTNIKTKDRFNFLTVVKEPSEKCELFQIDDFEFVGYELLDKDCSISALSNCGGFDETFLPSELNQFGLISDHEKAYDMRERLFANNPEEHHADCNVIAVWRHKTIGRTT